VQDFLEWDQSSTAARQFTRLFEHEITLDSLITPDPAAPALADDRPINEYFIIRRLRNPAYVRGLVRDLRARIGLGG
jgi:hypothetical protein